MKKGTGSITSWILESSATLCVVVSVPFFIQDAQGKTSGENRHWEGLLSRLGECQ